MTQLSLLTKEDAFDAFEHARPDWLSQARAVAVDFARKNGRVTIDDVRKVLPPPEDIDPRIMGAVFAGKQFVRVGYTNSNRATCHKRPISVFGLRP